MMKIKNKWKRRVDYVNMMDSLKKKENLKWKRKRERKEKLNCLKILKKSSQKNKDELIYVFIVYLPML